MSMASIRIARHRQALIHGSHLLAMRINPLSTLLTIWLPQSSGSGLLRSKASAESIRNLSVQIAAPSQSPVPTLSDCHPSRRAS